MESEGWSAREAFGRVWTDARRELLRPSTARLATAYVGASTLLALFFGGGRYFEWYLRTVYLFVPLLLVLLAARSVVRDHERGFAFVVATTPLTHREALAAKVVFLAVFLLVSSLLALPVTLVLTAMKLAPGTFLQVGWDARALMRVLAYALAGFFVGLFSGLVGLAAGHVMTRSPRGSPWKTYLGGAAALVWFGLAALAAFLALRPERSSTPVEGLLQVSPVSLAFDALDLTPETHVVDDAVAVPLDVPLRISLVLGLALLVVAALAALTRAHGRRAPVPWVVAGLLGVALVAWPVVATASFGVTEDRAIEGLLPAAGVQDLVIRSVVEVVDKAGGPLTLPGSGAITVRLHVEGPKAEGPTRPAYVIDRLCVVSPGISFTPPAGAQVVDGCIAPTGSIPLDAAGRGVSDAFRFGAVVAAPDGDLTSVRVDARLTRIDIAGIPPLDLSLGNPLGVTEAATALGKPARLSAVFAVGAVELAVLALVLHARSRRRQGGSRRTVPVEVSPP